MQGQARARDEAKAAQEAEQKAEAYSAKLKVMLEKALVRCPLLAGPLHAHADMHTTCGAL